MHTCELAKVINKGARKTHQKKISKARYNKEETEKKRQPRKKTNAFRINNDWYKYNDSGSLYDDMIKSTSKSDDAMFYVKKLKD